MRRTSLWHDGYRRKNVMVFVTLRFTEFVKKEALLSNVFLTTFIGLCTGEGF